MKILVTNASAQLSQYVATSLSDKHSVRLSDRSDVSTDLEFVRSELGHDESTNDLVRGMDAIIHSGEVEPGASVSEQLDVAMRCTYNLLWAASEEKVPTIIFLSSLLIFDRHEWGMVVTERWRPAPSKYAPVLSHHLGEYVCKEFARERKLNVVCLRLGEFSPAENRPDAWNPSSLGVYPVDVAQAVEKALAAGLSGWNVFHIQSDVPRKRYLTTAAENTLGFAPTKRS